MILSFKKTTDPDYSKLLVLLDKDDKTLGQYFEYLPPSVETLIFDRTNDSTLTTEIINRAFKMNSNFDFYSVTNDDIEYETIGWDKKLSNKGKVSTSYPI